MTDGDLGGRRVIAIAPGTLRWAADQMVETLGPETLKKLKVRSGEHLAALLTTTFLVVPPTGIDIEGGVDLWFDLSSAPDHEILPDGATSAAFEIKSMPGPFRQFDSNLDRDQARGVDTIGRAHHITIREANDVVRDMEPVLHTAADQLHRKASAETSRNIFLVLHPFDHFIAEWEQPVLGPLLDPLPHIDGVDTAWVLWPLDRLTVWSYSQRDWTNLLYNVGDPEAETTANEWWDLQDAEDYFLTHIGHTEGSPYLFHISAGDSTEEDG